VCAGNVKAGIVGKGVMVDVGGISVAVLFGVKVYSNVSAKAAAAGPAGPKAASINPNPKIREKSFFIVQPMYPEWNYTSGNYLLNAQS